MPKKKPDLRCTDCRITVPRSSICDGCKKNRQLLAKIHHDRRAPKSRASGKREEIHRGRAAALNKYFKIRRQM